MAFDRSTMSAPSRSDLEIPYGPVGRASSRRVLASPVSAAEHREAVRLVYERLAERYDPARDLWARTLGREIEATIDRWINRYASGATRVLDLGCGTGANLARLLRFGRDAFSYTGVDGSEDMLSVARRKFGSRPEIRFLRMDLEDLHSLDRAFDLVVSTYAFSHLQDPVQVLREALATVAPGGSLVLAAFTEPVVPLRPILRPLERWLQFRCIPRPTVAAFRDWREKAVFQGGLITAWVWTEPTT